MLLGPTVGDACAGVVPDPGRPTEWLRALLPLCLLGVIAEGETYGYAIAQRLQAGGLGVIKGGTLYPVLTRLEEDGPVTCSWREGVGGLAPRCGAVVWLVTLLVD